MRPEPVTVVPKVVEAIADLTIAEADAVLEAVRLIYRIQAGPTTNRDARELLAQIEERPK